MKHLIVTVLLFVSAGQPCAKGGQPSDLCHDAKFIQFLAGIELIDRSKSLSDSARSEKYRELCLVTGLTADSVAKRVLRFKADPGLWQQVRAGVLELLQKSQ